MATKGITFDQDCKKLVQLLLTKYAVGNSGYWEYSGQIDKQISFEVANRALVTMGCAVVPIKQKPVTVPK